MTKGQQKIFYILHKSRIKFTQQKAFSDLRGGHFRYDFYCPNINNSQVIIEFNGQQHYRRVSYFQKTQREFKTNQQHDRRKISYALANNIKIYCIPYWQLQNINSLSDILQDKFLARTRWHNDQMWQHHLNH